MEFLKNVVEKQGVHLQLWLEGENGESFGRGRVGCSNWWRELRSLSKAAKQLGMSYRGAWGEAQKARHIVGAALWRLPGPAGASLRPKARELVRRFQQWYEDVRSFANKRAATLFDDFDKQ